MNMFVKGQRWISESEPELGLGTVLQVGDFDVSIAFPGSEGTRRYALESAPLKRVRFREGDSVNGVDGEAFTVTSVAEREGLLVYCGAGVELPETGLCDSISFSRPEDRLLGGHCDTKDDFDLRCEALVHQYRLRKSEVCGLIGGRIDLIPHQLYIAHEVARRHNPRVLLADEVGLGKTIEAGLILHRLLQSGRAQRVLILVPESLVHQWFVEMLRRFNIWFSILDSESLAEGDNPFLENQLFICSIEALAGNALRCREACAADWDMLVVDEAHHLEWSPEAVSAEYAVVEALSKRTPGLLLLTATPEQLGVESHFARLRLLDPDRYVDLDSYVQEAESYHDVASLAGKVLDGKSLTRSDREVLAGVLAVSKVEAGRRVEEVEAGLAGGKERLLDELLDRHGPGRVMFRNTRGAMRGFPKRTAMLEELSWDGGDGAMGELMEEALLDLGESNDRVLDFRSDPRVEWLVGFLRRLKGKKVLLICRTREKVFALEAALREKINAKIALFHEELPLVQRDRQAAWFAEEDGAQMLICSEIGSEGRNFQFAHHLVLFDVPLDPELLEQRIGRLDRIGQTETIRVHVPYVAGSPQAVLVRWMHEGLNAFESNLQGGHELRKRFGERLRLLIKASAKDDVSAELERLLSDTRCARLDLCKRLEEGRDRLLEMNSFRRKPAAVLVKDIAAWDEDRELEAFMLRVFDHFGIESEEMSRRTYLLKPDNLFSDALPGFDEAGMTVTCDRHKALGRDDIQFLSWEHPLAVGAIDLLLGKGDGNCACAKWPDSGSQAILLEAIFVLETVAPSRLHVDRFMPATPMRVVVNHALEDCSRECPTSLFDRCLVEAPVHHFIDVVQAVKRLLPEMLAKGRELVESRSVKVVAAAEEAMEAVLCSELERLKGLQAVNSDIRADELEGIEDEIGQLTHHLGKARLRLDAIRLIVRS